jgi:adenine-specific DNA-methyltransferase
MFDPAGIEAKRLIEQRRLDLARSQTDRNRRGQFATPSSLADDMLGYARTHFGTKPVRFLDPAIGTGSFYSALLRTWPCTRIAQATGFEVDPYYATPCGELWAGSGLQLQLDDFTRAPAPRTTSDRYNLIICNPPYVRHHHLGLVRKRQLRGRSYRATGMRLSALAGLYAHFMLIAHAWMMPDALAGWLIPAEFMDVNYGAALREYLLGRVKLCRIHRFDPTDVQFDDALVSSALVWFRNSPPTPEEPVAMTQGGSLARPRTRRRIAPADLKRTRKWRSCLSRRGSAVRSTGQHLLGQFFRVQRGIATGSNDFFIMTREQAAERAIPPAYLRPILPGPKDLEVDEVTADSEGRPMLARSLLLMDCRDNQDHVRTHHPEFWRYLESGIGAVSRRYLCSRRTPWYSQERRPAPLFFCSYFARPRTNGRLQRFIFNRSSAIAANSYLLLYPRDELARFIDGAADRARAVWRELCAIGHESLSCAGRVYGGGMYKLEPRELADISVPGIGSMLGKSATRSNRSATTDISSLLP